MFAALLGIIPVLGPIVSAFLDQRVKLASIDAGVRTTEVNASTQQLIAFKDDNGLRLLRDLAIAPWVVWAALIGWDTIVALRYPWLKFNVADPPQGVAYLPGLSLTFLLGNIGLNMWKR